MRKTAFLLAILLVISIPLSVSAVEPRALDIEPILRFNGTTANCEVIVVGNNMSESIEVTMELMRGTYCVDRWTSSGYGYIHMNETATVTSGRTYQLVVYVTFRGEALSPVSVSGTC